MTILTNTAKACILYVINQTVLDAAQYLKPKKREALQRLDTQGEVCARRFFIAAEQRKGGIVMDTFRLPTKIILGGQGFDRLLQNVKRAFVVTDKFMMESKKVQYITDRLDRLRADYQIFSDVGADPDTDMVAAGMAVLMQQQPDIVITFGGGSAIDAAKAIVYFTQREGKMKKCPFVAIPTTSGTGSEVSSFAVITDRAKGIKYPIVDDSLLPDYAILDAELTRSVPPSVTADTGLDVFTHAVEAYVSTEANAFSDAMAEKAIELVHQYLIKAFQNPNDLEARQGMHNASCMAGIAFSNAGLGLNHGMAHALGAHAHLPHGRANSILLPFVMGFNAGCWTGGLTPVAKRYAELAEILGMGAGSTRQSALNLIHQARRYASRMHLPENLKMTGIRPENFEQMLEPMAEAALADRCTQTNPRTCTKEDIINLYRKAYDGRLN